MKTVRWGILSTAKIAVEKVVPAMMRCKYTSVVAISSRNIEKAATVARRFSIPRAYGSYEEMLADPDIDVIYNPLPNHLHVSWSIKALEAGKHVLCEKPIGLNSDDAQKLIAASLDHPKLKIMEAFMYRLHPQWIKAKSLVKEGAIGELKTIQSFFSYYNTDADNIRNKPESGGGSMMDIGCYCISLSRFIFDEEPRQVFGKVDYDPMLKIDRLASGILLFEKGSSTFTCSTQLTAYQRVIIFGTLGKIEIEIPFNAPADKSCKIWLSNNGKIKEFAFKRINQYAIQAETFSAAILNDTAVPVRLIDAFNNMKVMEAIFESDKNNCVKELSLE